MKFIQELLNNLFFKITRSSAPQSTKDEIVQILNKTIDDVSAGTKRIDDQIADLRALERQIDEITQNRTSLGTADDLEFTKFKTENTALDDLLNDFSTKTGASPEEARRVLIERANEGYPPGSPKRMSDEDDDRLRAFIESQKLMGNEQDLMIDVLENAQLPEDQLRAIREIAEEGDALPFGKSGEAEEFIKNRDALPFGKSGEAEEYIDSLIKSNQQKQTDLARVEELMMNPDNFGKSFDEILQMVQDEKVIPFMKFAPNPKPKKAEGGIISRIGLQDGGGPKIRRRGFLGMLGAGIGSLFMPKGVKKIAEMAAPARVITPAPGMPDWFPLLVNQIKTKGKITREPKYDDFTSGGDTTVRYQLNDNSLAGNEIFMEEDLQTGAVSIFGRGDDFQQVSLDYTPGERTIAKGGKIRESEPSFEAGEFFKGEIQDVENFVDSVDDLRGEVVSWRKLSGIDMTPKEKIKGSIQRFKDEFKNPNPEPEEFAQGGGVGSLFKERAM